MSLVYFDSSDLIDIAERGTPCTLDELDALLRTTGCSLALSISGVLELAAPLLSRTASTNVMSLLNRIEALPLRYLHEARIFPLELGEALSAFTGNRDYRPVCPLVDRVDDAIPLRGRPPTRLYLSYSLAEYVYDQWSTNPRAFPPIDEHTQLLEQRLQAARTTDPRRPQGPSFSQILMSYMPAYGMTRSAELEAFASWVQSDPNHCPSIQLVYQIAQAMLRNVTDAPKRGDMFDLIHIQSLPYVDAQTVDRRMFSYLTQACAQLGSDLAARAFVRSQRVLEWLRDKGDSG